MTVISAGIVNKQGRVILARQFVDVSRTRIESLLSAFPRLLETAAQSQVTFIDADTVRYVYQPLDDFYLVLVTTNTTTSNIVDDLATLQLMRRLIPDRMSRAESAMSDGGNADDTLCAGGLTEELLETHVFHIFMALDEVIVAGKREDTELDDIQRYLAMDSAEERSAQEVKRAQVEKARRVTAERARELRERRRAGMLHARSVDGMSLAGTGDGGGGMYEGIGSSDGGAGASPAYESSAPPHPYYSNDASRVEETRPGVVMRATAPRSTMALGKTNKTGLTRRVQEEMRITGAVRTAANDRVQSDDTNARDMNHHNKNHKSSSSANSSNFPHASASAAAAAAEDGGAPTGAMDRHTLLPYDEIAAVSAPAGVQIVIEERISATLPRDGEPAETDIKGELSVRVSDPALDRLVLRLAPVSADFVFRAHAKIDKALFARESVLAMLEDRPLPVQQAVTVLRWRLSRPGSIQPPITFSCWPEVGSLTVDYELVNEAVPPLTQVQLRIPVRGGVLVSSCDASVGRCVRGGRAVASVSSPDQQSLQEAEDVIIWLIDEVSAAQNVSGHVEITLAGGEDTAAALFPIDVSFTSHVSVGLVHVNDVISTTLKTPVRFNQEARLVTEQLRIL